MNLVTKEQLAKLGIDESWVDPLNETFVKFGIDTPLRQAAFIGQCQHESSFKNLTENLNYSKEGLCKIWPSRFPTLKDAEPYHRNPEKIANKVYAKRMGNSDEASGEGWLYRGRGLIQITGKSNVTLASKELGLGDLFVAYPDLIATPKFAALTAGWFWNANRLNTFADRKDWVGLTKKINGATIGLEHRIECIEKAIKVLS